FAFDPALGTFVNTTGTLGPLFAERAPSLGRGKFDLSVSATFFEYDEFEGRNLSHFNVDFLHDPDAIPPNDVRTDFELDIIRATMDINIDVQIYSVALTYGITDRLDVGALLPLVHVDMDVVSHARIVVSPSNTNFPNIH